MWRPQNASQSVISDFLSKTSMFYLLQVGMASVTLVIPRTPIFGLEEVEPFPVPKRPAMMQQTPSVKIPLKKTKSVKHLCGRILSGNITLPSVSPVDGMDRRGRGSRETSTGIIIADRLHDTRHRGTQHSQHPGNCYHRQPPLAYQRQEVSLTEERTLSEVLTFNHLLTDFAQL